MRLFAWLWWYGKKYSSSHSICIVIVKLCDFCDSFWQRYDLQIIVSNRRVAPNAHRKGSTLTKLWVRFNLIEVPFIDHFFFLSTQSFIKSSLILNYSTLTIGFKNNICIRYRRSVYMTWADMLGNFDLFFLSFCSNWDGIMQFVFLSNLIRFSAAFGGIFGLCLGGSIISLVEIAYFVFVQIFSKFLPRIDPENKNDKKNPVFGKIYTITRNKPNRRLGVMQ